MSSQEQIDYWNGQAGEKWVAHASQLDAMLRPFAIEVLNAANISQSDNVLDIGCGGGALSLLAAQSAARLCGVDVSAPLITLARKRAAGLNNVTFHCADAAEFRSDEPYDVAVSRFGVMFFHNPVAAFSNIRKIMKPQGRLAFACWQSPVKNDWARAPLEVALPFLTTPPEPPKPNAPGPFAFADRSYLKQVLADAGWQDVTFTDWSGKMALPGTTVDEAADFMLKMGPLSRLIAEQELDFEAVKSALASKLQNHIDAEGVVHMGASAWIVTAKV